jgi:hypothetical protein
MNIRRWWCAVVGCRFAYIQEWDTGWTRCYAWKCARCGEVK